MTSIEILDYQNQALISYFEVLTQEAATRILVSQDADPYDEDYIVILPYDKGNYDAKGYALYRFDHYHDPTFNSNVIKACMGYVNASVVLLIRQLGDKESPAMSGKAFGEALAKYQLCELPSSLEAFAKEYEAIRDAPKLNLGFDYDTQSVLLISSPEPKDDEGLCPSCS